MFMAIWVELQVWILHTVQVVVGQVVVEEILVVQQLEVEEQDSLFLFGGDLDKLWLRLPPFGMETSTLQVGEVVLCMLPMDLQVEVDRVVEVTGIVVVTLYAVGVPQEEVTLEVEEVVACQERQVAVA